MNDGENETLNLYAWLGRDADGVEGILTVGTDSGLMPLVCTDVQTAMGVVRNAARQVGEIRNVPVHLVAFTRSHTVKVIEP